MTTMYDAIAVGARCAGSPTAMLLARKGYRVLLLDRAAFPSDTLSTHYIHQPGVACLKRWGLLERIVASNCPPVLRQMLDFGPFALVGSPPPANGVAEAYAPRRRVLDRILAKAAVAAGAQLREHLSVRELVTDGERVVGIRGRAAGGAMVSEKARIVIGADGLHSLVARTVHAATYQVRPALTCAYYSTGARFPYRMPSSIRGSTGRSSPPRPTTESLYHRLLAQRRFSRGALRYRSNFSKALDLAPGLAERAGSGTRTEPFRGTAVLPNFYRKPYGPGWALVGDAGYHKDPITALGISDAFRDTELLSGAIDKGLSGRRPLEDELADYERRRNEASLPLFEMTCQFATLQPPPPEQQELFAALRQDQEQTDLFMGTDTGTVPIPKFFAPENIGRIVAAVGPGEVA